MIKPFSPISMAERDKLAASVVRALEEVRECDLENIDLFLGAGIYALYYLGSFPAYSRLAESNLQRCAEPIYVGKAEPSGSCRGISTETRIRFLVMDDEWVRFGESVLSREVAEYLKSLSPRQSVTMNRECSLHTKSEILSSISRSSKNERRL